MEIPTASASPLPASAWTPMHVHVRTYLAGHPLLHGFHVHTAAGDGGIVAELQYYDRRVSASRDGGDWWRPCTPEHGREIADALAHDLYGQWLGMLRHR